MKITQYILLLALLSIWQLQSADRPSNTPESADISQLYQAPEDVQRVILSTLDLATIKRLLISNKQHSAFPVKLINIMIQNREFSPFILWNLSMSIKPLVFQTHTEAVLPNTCVSLAIRSLALSANKKLLLTGSDDGTARLWDLNPNSSEDGSKKQYQELKQFKHANAVYTVSLTPDGTKALTGSLDRTAKIWDLTKEDIKPELSINCDNPVIAAALDMYAANALICIFPVVMEVWDIQKRKRMRSFNYGNRIKAVALSPDGKIALFGLAYGEAILRNVVSGKKTHVFKHKENITSVALNTDKHVALIAGGKIVSLWDTITGQRIKYFDNESNILSAALSADGSMAFIGLDNGTATLWNIKLGKRMQKFMIGKDIHGKLIQVHSVAISSDNSMLIAGLSDGRVIIWDITKK